MVNNMNLSSATNKQLITITNYDRECPKELMEKVVMEMLERRIFKNFIFDISRGYTFKDMTHDEIEQFGNISIWKALQAYKPGKAAFVSLAKKVFHYQLGMHHRKRVALKRQITNFSFYLEDQEGIQDILPDETNVERYVLHRIYIEEQLNILTPLQKAAVLGYMKGYRLKEVAKQLNKDRTSVERAFHKAVEKMGGEKFSIKDNCGVKGA